MCKFFDGVSISSSEHQGCEVVHTSGHVFEREFFGAVKDGFVGLCSVFEGLVGVGNITQFLVSIEVFRLFLENFFECFLCNDGVYIFVNACRQFESFDVVGFIVQHFVKLLSSATPVFAKDANATAQHQTRHVGGIELINLFCTLVGARINLLIQEELTNCCELFLILLYF